MHGWVNGATNISSLHIYSQTINNVIRYFFAVFVPQLPIAPATSKKSYKANLSRLVSQADLSQISPASQPPAF